MGTPAERATNDTKAKVNDLLIRGYLISVNKGSKTKRIAIGLGDGSSELKTAVEGFQTTAQGPRARIRRTGCQRRQKPRGGAGICSGLAAANAVILVLPNEGAACSHETWRPAASRFSLSAST
jgi:hypothetical protein